MTQIFIYRYVIWLLRADNYRINILSASIDKFIFIKFNNIQNGEKESRFLMVWWTTGKKANSSMVLHSICFCSIYVHYLHLNLCNYTFWKHRIYEYMNITIVFLFIAMVSYFLISLVFFISEEKGLHWIPAFLFFAGVSTIMVYAFKAIDTSNLVRFSIIYTIIVAAISTYVLAVKRK